MKVYWNKMLTRAAVFCGAAAFLCSTVATVDAQISFGKMRDAAEKQNGAPKVEDDEAADAFDVKPGEKSASKADADEKTPAKPSARRSMQRRSSGRSDNPSKAGSARATKTTTVASKENADATNSLANAMNDPDEQDAPASIDAGSGADSDEQPAAPANSAQRSVRGVRTPSVAKASKDSESDGSASASNGKNGPVLGKAVSHKYRAGMFFRAAANGTCTNLIGTAPVPTEFPEQKVRTLEEEFPKSAKVDYRDVKEGGARQLVFKMRELKAGQGVQATALFEVVRYPIMPPSDPSIYAIPKKIDPELRRYLKDGPYIESNSKTVKALAKETTENVDGAWDKVAAILAYVRDNIQYKEVMVEKPMRGALAALKTRDGDCEDMSALFIALCRANEIPARLVRVPGHCWAEFYLVDGEKEGYWFPAQVAGTEELGSLQDTRVILQKGDNFRLPEEPKEEALYVKELFMGTVKDGGANPEHQFIQETDPKE